MKKARLGYYNQHMGTRCLPFLVILAVILGWSTISLAANERGQRNESSSPLSEEIISDDLGFLISFKIFDLNTGRPQSTFYFGDQAGYELTVNIPPAAQGKTATVNLSATVKIGGVTLPFTTSNVFSGPLINPSYKEVDLFEPRTWNGQFKIPSNIPLSELRASVKVVITVKDTGTAILNKTITIRTKNSLPKPALISPVDGAVASMYRYDCSSNLYRTNGYFEWTEVQWATKYELLIKDKLTNSTMTYETTNNYYWGSSPCMDSSHQYWSWKVRAGNEYCWSEWSDERNITLNYPPGKATLISPSGSISTNTPAYTWNAVSNSTSYNLRVNDSTGTKINTTYTAVQANCAGGTGTCSITPGTALALGSASWWIQTYNYLGWGPTSDVMAFTVSSSSLPGKATLISPSLSIITTTPTYTWNAVSNATSYNLRVDDSTGTKINQTFTAAQANCPSGIGTCSVTPGTALAPGSASWWIQTYNSLGWGPTSDAMLFTVSTCSVIPGKATLVSPSGTIGTNQPTFTWNADAHSEWYWLLVSDSTGNYKINTWYSAAQAGCPNGTGQCSVAPGVALVPGSASWWVGTYNACGYGPWSDGMSFTVP
jgi:hypothetical protein